MREVTTTVCVGAFASVTDISQYSPFPLARPEGLIEPEELVNDPASQMHATLEPVFIAHIAARQEDHGAIDDDKLWVHDAERFHENAFDLQVKSREKSRFG